MVRKMMLDSLVHWAKEYHVDGFRFDLMGLHDLETMRQIRKAMDQIDPSILLYGEGWTGGDSPLPEAERAMKTNVGRLPRIAAFNDTLRDAIKGPVSEHLKGGFVQGAPGFEERLKTGIAASVRHPQIAYPEGDLWNGPWAKQPHHCVSYDSCHDNHALWDKLQLTTPGLKDSDRLAMNRLAAAIVLTSQGIAFLHAGEEMARSKKGHENSYNLPDSVNAMDWRRKTKYAGSSPTTAASSPSARPTRLPPQDRRRHPPLIGLPEHARPQHGRLYRPRPRRRKAVRRRFQCLCQIPNRPTPRRRLARARRRPTRRCQTPPPPPRRFLRTPRPLRPRPRQILIPKTPAGLPRGGKRSNRWSFPQGGKLPGALPLKRIFTFLVASRLYSGMVVPE
jgi:hypothetical protein